MNKKQWLTRVLSSRALNAAAHRLLPGWVTVFMLHRLDVPELGVRGLKPAFLEQCLAYLQHHGYRFISLEDAAQRALSNTLSHDKWIAFSLDDGFAEQVTLAGEIFAKFNCPSTCFLMTDFIDGKRWQWEQQLVYVLQQSAATSITIEAPTKTLVFDAISPAQYYPIIKAIRKHAPSIAFEAVAKLATDLHVEIPAAPPPHEQPASWSDIRSMEKKGMQFAPHTVTHRIVAGLSDAEQMQEIAGSIKRVREECENPSNIFCYPSGQLDEYDFRMFDKLRELGVTSAFSAVPGHLTASALRADPDYRFAIPRMAMPDTFEEFVQFISWAQYLYEKLQGRKAYHRRPH